MNIIFNGTNPISFALLTYLPLVILGLLLFNMLQRRFGPQSQKRMASFYLTLAVLIMLAFAFLIHKFSMPEYMLIPAFLSVLIGLVLFRKQVFPYKIRCAQCEAPLNPVQIFLKEGYLCSGCEETTEEEE